MNRVGEDGKGESVWLGFFLYDVLQRFARGGASARRRRRSPTHCRERGRAHCATTSKRTRWDGEWYRRAYFDDGTPLGSAQNDECRIDSISQSWAVLSGAADPARARQAMDSLDEHLVRARRRPGPAARSALRQDAARPRLHPRLRAGRARERRPVHACRDLGGDGLRPAGRSRQRPGNWLGMINPIHHARMPRRTQVYKVEPYVVAADVYARGAARGTRRLDLVHRFGRLDVPADHRIAARPASRRRPVVAEAVHSRPNGPATSCNIAMAAACT